VSVLGAGHVCKQSVQYNAAANCTTTRPSGKTTLLFDATPQHNTTQHNNTSQHKHNTTQHNSYSYISPTDPFKLLS